MKKIQLTIACFFVLFVLAVAVKAEVRIGGESWARIDTAGPSKYDHAEWQDPLIFAVNRLPPRNPAWPNPDTESGWKSDYEHSPWLQSLDGPWSFHWSPDPDKRPESFYQPGFDVSGWKSIPVPSCWELQGYGTPIYTNYTYPFKVDVPRVLGTPPEKYTSFTERDPVGSYRRTFTLPPGWKGGHTILHFAGVGSAMYVWVNGKKVGYSENSRLPAEFDITPFLQPGENLLAVEVYRYSDGSYLEDQDMWRLSGIFRDVFLYHTPDVTLWDFYTDAVLDAHYESAQIRVFYRVRNSLPGSLSGLRLRVSLRDPEGQVVGVGREGQVGPGQNGKRSKGNLLEEAVPVMVTGVNEEDTTAVAMVTHPKLWTPETPNLYSVLVELVQNGKVIEARRGDLGFRKVEMRDKQFFVNGRSIKIKGINRHEADPETGYTPTLARMKQDLQLIKQANFNFIRTSHYPNDPRWYELCDRYGIFIMDENNLETHGISYHRRILPGDKPEWEPAVVDRMRCTVIRDRSHASVVMWSLGNEAGYGNAFMKMRDATRIADPQLRPIHYADMNLAADMDSQTYPTTEWLLQHVAGKAVRKGEHGEKGSPDQHGPYPSGKAFVANEYAHAQANSLGNFQDYWDVYEKYPMLLGGFIWEWSDQALYKTGADGRRAFAYGGDFGDYPNDGRSCLKGLVSSDRLPRPHYYEVKKVQQYIRVYPERIIEGRVRIQNNYSFTSLDSFEVLWQLQENGSVIRQGRLEGLKGGPGSSNLVSVPFGKTGRGEYFLVLTFRLRKSTLWADAGFVVAEEQLVVPVKGGTGMNGGAGMNGGTGMNAGTGMNGGEVAGETGDGGAEWTRSGEDWTASAGGTTVRVDGRSGLLKSLVAAGREYLVSPVLPNFWRAPLDNDIGWKTPVSMAPWKDAGSRAELKQLQMEGKQLVADLRLPVEAATLQLTYRLLPDGRINLGLKLDLGKVTPELPRIGLQMAIPAALRRVKWYGRGPQETYLDRKTGAFVGIYRSTVDEWITPYVRPQENANRTDVRWVELGDEENEDGSSSSGRRGLSIQAGSRLLGISAWPYSAIDLETATHNEKLPRRDFITVNVDGWQMGVGGDISWGLPVHDEYRLLAKGVYEYSFYMGPVH